METKGVVLAGGKGARLLPATRVTNKHLLPVGEKPMILHAIDQVRKARIKDVMVITGTEHAGQIVGLLGSGEEFGLNLTYRIQDQAGGIAQALGLCREFVGISQLVVLLGDNIFAEPVIANTVFGLAHDSALIAIKKVPDPRRFGCPVFKHGKIIRIEEKPSRPKSQYAVVGLYAFPPDVFEVISMQKPSARGEMEITDVLNRYILCGRVTVREIKTGWSDAGTWESLACASKLVEKEDEP